MALVLLLLESCAGLALAWGLLRAPQAPRAVREALAAVPPPYVAQDDWAGLA